MLEMSEVHGGGTVMPSSVFFAAVRAVRAMTIINNVNGIHMLDGSVKPVALCMRAVSKIFFSLR